MKVELNPWIIPNFVTAKMPPRPRQEGFTEGLKWALAEVDADTLASQCDTFRAEVFCKAGKPDHAQRGIDGKGDQDMNDVLTLRALCTLLMCDDPTGLTQDDRERIEKWTDKKARAMGFDNWVDAYHWTPATEEHKHEWHPIARFPITWVDVCVTCGARRQVPNASGQPRPARKEP